MAIVRFLLLPCSLKLKGCCFILSSTMCQIFVFTVSVIGSPSGPTVIQPSSSATPVSMAVMTKIEKGHRRSNQKVSLSSTNKEKITSQALQARGVFWKVSWDHFHHKVPHTLLLFFLQNLFAKLLSFWVLRTEKGRDYANFDLNLYLARSYFTVWCTYKSLHVRRGLLFTLWIKRKMSLLVKVEISKMNIY